MPRIRNIAALASIALLWAGTALAQSYPSKPIRFIVPFPPGGSSDLVVRMLAPRMAEKLGQQVLVENRPGASGNIGVDIVAKAAPDGHTIGLGAAGALSSNSSLFPNMPFDPIKDLAPISMLAMIPIVIAAHSSLPVANAKELIAYAKANPGKLSFGTTGSGSTMHLAGEMLKQMTRTFMVHIPYKGSAPAAADLAGGQLELAIVDLTSALPHIRSGKVKAIAIASPQRSITAPEIPTVAESGLPTYAAEGWFGVVAPVGTPASIITRLNAEIVEGMKAKDIRDRLLTGGAEPQTGTPEAFGGFIKSETAKWARVIKEAGVKLD